MKYHNIEIESAILGSILLRPSVIDNVINEIQPQDFEYNDNRILLWVIYKIYNDGNPVELETLINYLKKAKRYNEVKDHLLDIAQNTGTSAGVSYFVEQIKEGKTKEKIDKLIKKLDSNLKSDQIPIDNSIQDIIACLNSIGSTARKESLTDLIKKYVSNTTGVFYLTDIYRDLVIRDRKQKHTVVVVLAKMIDDEVLEKSGKRSGCYRRICSDFVISDWRTADTTIFDIRMPFGLEQYVEILPADLILLAGVTNAGKSAMCFEFIRLNMRRHPVFYFSSEINDVGLKKRLGKSDLPLDEWNMQFSHEWDNPIDIIQPDAINIIDYIEPPDGEFYKIPQILTEIHHKLDKGIAICCIQKNNDKDFGAGGQQTMNKAALALNIDKSNPGQKMTVRKAKNYRGEINPNMFVMKFKIVNGIKLIPSGTWSID